MTLPDPHLPNMSDAARFVVQDLDGTVLHDRAESVELHIHAPDGSVSTQRIACAVQLADGAVIHPGESVELGVCEMCAIPPKKLFQPDPRKTGGLILRANGAFCSECGRFVCPKHRVTNDAETCCRDRHPSMLGPVLRALLFRRVD